MDQSTVHKKFRWVHISDLHAGKDEYGLEKLASGLLTFLKKNRDDHGYEPDLILFTGDIANTGKKIEYRLFNDKILFPLIDLFGEEIIPNLLFVPGNHDIDRDLNPLVHNTYSLLDRYPTLMDQTPKAHQLRRELIERFSAFREAMPAIHDMDALFGKEAFFVRTVVKDTLQIGIVGLNTAWLCQSDQDKLQLTAGRFAVQSGLQAIAGCTYRFVIGHHPVSWFREDDGLAIGAMLAQQNAIYLHGHLHETFPGYQNHGAHQFLAIQAGAIFDARESKVYPPTILFGELNPELKQIELEPFQWNPMNQEWAFSTNGMPESHRSKGESRFCFPLPTSKIISKAVVKEQKPAPTPEGWVSIARSTVNKWTEAPPTASQILSFFDGRPPSWSDAASHSIPNRDAVGDIVNDVIAGLKEKSCIVILLTGPSGEGKSTALKQACCAVMRREPDTKLLFRNDEDASLESEHVLNHLDPTKCWLIASDDAGNLSQAIHFQAQIIGGNANRSVVYLLAARDTDWISNKGKSLTWNTDVVRYKEYVFRGITLRDATHVVHAWNQYGGEGMQSLRDKSVEEGARLLHEASLLENETTEGAFLGAMLRVRYGKELRAHIESVLGKLSQIAALNQYTLLDVFSVIVSMHRIALPILDKKVLSEYLGAKEADVRRFAIAPLGDEAMVSAGAHRLLTRHKAIADVAYDLLETKYGYTFIDIYRKLISVALDISSSGRFLRSFGRWRYLSRELKLAGEMEMAIEIARLVISRDPSNTFLIVHLASLYRQANRLDLALEGFRSSNIESAENRAFFTEWGAAEEADENHYASFWISSLAIRELRSARDVTNDDAKMALSELVVSGKSIFNKYNSQHFLRAAAIAQVLGLKLPLSGDEKEAFANMLHDVALPKVDQLSLAQMLTEIEKTCLEAKESALASGAHIPSGDHATGFESFQRLLGNIK